MLRGASKNNGFFDIHMAWVSIRGVVDRVELVLHDVIWLNHPNFTHSPFVLYIKEIRVSFEPIHTIYALRYSGGLKIDEVMIDSMEVFFERADINQEKGHLNIFSAIGVQEFGKAGSMLRGVVSGLITLIEEKLTEKLIKKPIHRLFSNEAYNRNPPITVELNRAFIVDLVVHPLDLLSGCHRETSGIADIRIPLMFLTHRDLCGREGEPLPADEFGDKFGDAFGAALATHNSASIAALLAASATNRTVTAAQTAFSSRVRGSLTQEVTVVESVADASGKPVVEVAVKENVVIRTP